MNPDGRTPLPPKETILPLIASLIRQAEAEPHKGMQEFYRTQANLLRDANKISSDEVQQYLLRNS